MAVKGYSWTQIALHWAVVVLITVNLIFEDWIKAGWEIIEEGGAAVYDALRVVRSVWGFFREESSVRWWTMS